MTKKVIKRTMKSSKELDIARQIIKAASFGQTPRLQNILGEFDNFTKNLSDQDKRNLDTEEIMRILIKVGRKAKNNDFLSLFDSMYSNKSALHNETFLNTNGSVSTKSGFTAGKSASKRQNFSIRSNIQTTNNTLEADKLNKISFLKSSGFEDSSKPLNNIGSNSIDARTLQNLYQEKRSFLTNQSLKKSSSKSKSGHSKQSKESEKSRSTEQPKFAKNKLQNKFKALQDQTSVKNGQSDTKTVPKNSVHLHNLSRRLKQTSFRLSKQYNRSKTTPNQRKSRSVSPIQHTKLSKVSKPSNFDHRTIQDNNIMYVHTEPYIVETQNSQNFSPRTHKSQNKHSLKFPKNNVVSRNLSKNFDQVQKSKSIEPKIPLNSYTELFEYKQRVKERSLSKERSQNTLKYIQHLNGTIEGDSTPEEIAREAKFSIPVRTKKDYEHFSEIEPSADLKLVSNSQEFQEVHNLGKIQKNLRFDESLPVQSSIFSNDNDNWFQVQQSIANKSNSAKIQQENTYLTELIKKEKISKFGENRVLNLKASVFYQWKTKVSKYKEIKRYIIHSLCLQKMKSKVLIFTTLKNHYREKKREERNIKLALGHRAICLLKTNLMTWYLKAKKAKKLKYCSEKISTSNQLRIKKNTFLKIKSKYKQENAISKSLQQRVNLLIRNKKEKVFRELVETIDDSLFEKSLEKRSRFFFGYWGAREFFKCAFLFSNFKKTQRINEKKVKDFIRKKAFEKGFYTLVEYYNSNQTLESKAVFHYFKTLITKSFYVLNTIWQENKLPERHLTEREVALGYKFISVISQGVTYRNNDLSSVRDYLAQQTTGRLAHYNGHNPIYRVDHAEESFSEQSEPESEKSKVLKKNENHGRMESVIEHQYTEESAEGKEESQQNELSANLYSSHKQTAPNESQRFSTGKLFKKVVNSHESHSSIGDIQEEEGYSQEEEKGYSESDHQYSYQLDNHSVNLIAEMPILVEKINPPKFIQTTYQYNMSVLRSYFEALKYITRRRKQFLMIKELERKQVLFDAFRRFTHDQQLMRFIENKMRLKRAKKYLRSSFDYLKCFARKMKLLRHAEAEYTLNKDCMIVQDYFSKFVSLAKTSKIEKFNYLKAIEFRARFLIHKGYCALKNRLEMKRDYQAKFKLIHAKEQLRGKVEILRNWQNLAYFKRRIGYSSRNLERLIQGNLMSHAMELILNTAQTQLKYESISWQIQNNAEMRLKAKSLTILSQFAIFNKTETQLNEYSAYHYNIVILTKAMVAINVYKRYKHLKMKQDQERTTSIQKNSLRHKLLLWKSKTLHFAKVHHFRALMTRLFKKQVFRQHKNLLLAQIVKKEQFFLNINQRKLEQFFCEWRRFSSYKSTLLKLKKQYQIDSKSSLKEKYLNTWYSKLSSIKFEDSKLNSAIQFRKESLLAKVVTHWKQFSYFNSIPRNNKKQKVIKIKLECLLALQRFKDKNIALRRSQKILEEQQLTKLLKKYWARGKAQFKKLKILNNKLEDYQLDFKKKWFILWVEEANYKKNRTKPVIELTSTHHKVSKYAEKLTAFQKDRFRFVFRTFKNAIENQKENKGTHIKAYKLIKQRHNFRTKLSILKTWVHGSKDRALTYKKLSKVDKIITTYHLKLDFEAKKTSLNNIRGLFLHIKREDKLNSKADKLLQLTRKAKLFKMLALNKEAHSKMKTALSKLKDILNDKKSKFEAFRTLENIYKRKEALQTLLLKKNHQQTLQNKSKVLKRFRNNLARERKIENQIHQNTVIHNKKTLKKVVLSLSRLVHRKKIFKSREERIKVKHQNSALFNMFTTWKESVIDNQASLHNKSIMLKDAIKKLHILRVLDDLQNFKETAKQRKELISEKVFNLEYIITLNNKIHHFRAIVDHCEKKIEVEGKISQLCLTLQNHLEIQIQHDGFKELRKHQKRQAYLEVLTHEMRRRKLKKSMLGFKKYIEKFCLNKRILEEKVQKSLKKGYFLRLKAMVLSDKTSLYNREHVLKEKLKTMRIRQSVKKLLLNKERNSFKARRISRAVIKLSNTTEKISLFSQHMALKLMTIRSKTIKFTLSISTTIDNLTLKNTFKILVNKLKFEKKSEIAFKTLDKLISYNLLSKTFSGLHRHKDYCKQLQNRCEEFREFSLANKQANMFRNWIDLVFSDPDSFYNKQVQAEGHYNRSLKIKIMSSLIKNLKAGFIEQRIAEMTLNRVQTTQRQILLIIKQKVVDSQEKFNRTLLLKVFLQWKEFVKNNKLLTSYLNEEQELLNESIESHQQNNQKERFLNLLMPNFNHHQSNKSDTSKSKGKRYHELSDQGDYLNESEDNSNSFADFKSAI